MIGEVLEAVLQRAARWGLLQRIGNLLPRRPARAAAHGFLDRLQFLFQDAPYHVAALSFLRTRLYAQFNHRYAQFPSMRATLWPYAQTIIAQIACDASALQ